MHLHCPKCGDLLAEDRETLYCRRGDMEFSRMLDERYRRHFAEKKEPAPDVRWSCKVGGDWFCPECGQKMEEVDGRILCHRCGINLAAFVRHLIEVHPHRTESGALI